MSFPEEPVPLRLLRVVHGDLTGRERSNVVLLRRRRVRRWSWPQCAALAASLVVGAIAGRLAPVRTATPIVMRGGRLLADGALADALSDQLAADQTAADPVRIGVSFRAKSGEYCRAFSLPPPTTLAGLACRAAEGWRVGVLAREPAPGAISGSGPQAAAFMPAVVMAAVGHRIAGKPLDAAGEAAARMRHWRP